MKVCNKCRKEKPLNEFYKLRRSKDGLQGKCKPCSIQTVSEWQRNNYDRFRAINDKWHTNNQHKQDIYNEKNKNKISSGVYKIKCLVNGKCYIGQSNKPNRRKYEHFSVYKSNQPKPTHPLLQADIKQYGKHNFIFGIIEHCPIELLDERETYYINVYKPEYNLHKTHLETL
jgi:hypothetical protein